MRSPAFGNCDNCNCFNHRRSASLFDSQKSYDSRGKGFGFALKRHFFTLGGVHILMGCTLNAQKSAFLFVCWLLF